MTGIVHDPVHRADVRRDHSIHPKRLRVDRSGRGEALQYLEAISGMLSRQPHRLGVGRFQSRVFDSRVRSANAEDVVVWFHCNSEEGEQDMRGNRRSALFLVRSLARRCLHIGVRWTEFHGFLSSLDLHEWQQSTQGEFHGWTRLFLRVVAVRFWFVRLMPQKWQRFFPLLMRRSRLVVRPSNKSVMALCVNQNGMSS